MKPTSSQHEHRQVPEGTGRPVVVKVGGSLFDWPGLRDRLNAWLLTRSHCRILLVPGGGAGADVVRRMDQVHRLGAEASHWLALRVVACNARLLSQLAAGARVTATLQECDTCWEAGALPVLDGHAFCRADEGRPGHLAHAWDVTTDSVAARVAVVAGARELVLLKSTDLPPGISWEEAGRRGLVDNHFAAVLKPTLPPVEVHFVNLKTWRGDKVPRSG